MATRSDEALAASGRTCAHLQERIDVQQRVIQAQHHVIATMAYEHAAVLRRLAEHEAQLQEMARGLLHPGSVAA